MTPLTITKDEYSGKWVAWHLPSKEVVRIKNAGHSKAFWKCTSNFYLLGVGDTKETAVDGLKSKITDFTNWLSENHSELSVNGISSNSLEYRQAIYEFNYKVF